jgi:TPR repeat protein
MTPIIRFLTIAITVAISQLGSEAIAKPDAASNFSNAVRFLEDERMDDALIALRAGCLEGVEDGYELMCDAVLSYYETGTTGLIAEPESVRHAGAIEAFRIHAGEICESGYGAACLRLARFSLSQEGVFEGRSLDDYRACESRNEEACTAFGSNWMAGTYGRVDFQRAREAFWLGCDYNDLVACRRLADMLVTDRGGSVNVAVALQVNSLACPRSGGLEEASRCMSAAAFARTHDDAELRRDQSLTRYFWAACDLGEPDGCIELIDIVETLLARHSQKRPNLAADLRALRASARQRLCANGDLQYCQ